MIDSNYSPNSFIPEQFTLDRANVTIKLSNYASWDPPPGSGWWSKVVPARYVFDLVVSPNSYRGAVQKGAWMTVAIFDLPLRTQITGYGNPTYPLQAWITVLKNGAFHTITEFQIVGASGKPNPIASSGIFGTLLTDMGPRRMVRLRPKRGSPGFLDGLATIGGVQFELVYDAPCESGGFVSAFAATDAAGATVMVGPINPAGSNRSMRKIVLAHPTGFNITYVESAVAGQGPILDVVFAPIPNPGGCNLGSFSVDNLLVTGLDGETLVQQTDNNLEYFASYIVTPPPF